ncbi:serine hydrolase-like protein [Carassius auratus]|uniref:Serine hydrolase-like protein n=1 Tax=Carassius auratus TaxID=7957 RepID=A0A6P6PEQ5_CARAU|nr:serine hydrolase-like protein [Carassius auratus]XP_026118910.1 serine hydrolase-like protein [Carassius auratus]XP_052401977.1 serine hydrolase-like protein [Carassius gibelio]XP_052401978.1 serine hydrolase-like protein [Carassius gibelio]XP_052401979.1 serine hydrolase-like protein [Carassius gibelio]XP_052401980.1 serine hydrolase-like protein [Carassius gibelio]XP_052401981.1 serine hydrolase-like protein [Carassius gibelio]
MLPAFTSLRHLATNRMRRAASEFRMTVPWGEIRGQVWGPSNGRPVLCLHGWADNCGTFNSLIPLLPKDWRFVAIDFPGHGLSSHRPDGCFYNFPLYAADVRRVVEALQWKRFSIMGHSMGGNVAGTFSALYPEMIDAVVLLDTYGFLPTQVTDIFKNLRKGITDQIQYDNKTEERKERVYTYEKAKERLKAANPSLSDQSADILLERAIREVEGGFVFTRDFRINLKNTVSYNMEQCLHMMSQVKAPVMILLAKDGLFKTFALPDGYVDLILKSWANQKATIVNVEGDHHIHLNKPESMASIITDFLQSHSPVKPQSESNNNQSSKL